MLRAEWETLNRPERLERLANEFLDLVPPSPDQITGYGDVTLPEITPVSEDYEAEQNASPVLEPILIPVSTTRAPIPRAKPPRPAQGKRPAPAKANPPVKSAKPKGINTLIDELGGDQ